MTSILIKIAASATVIFAASLCIGFALFCMSDEREFASRKTTALVIWTAFFSLAVALSTGVIGLIMKIWEA